MPCQLCKESNEDDDIEICSNCLKFLNGLKCSECHKSVPISFKKKFNVICHECVDNGKKPEIEQIEKIEKLKEEEEEMKKKI